MLVDVDIIKRVLSKIYIPNDYKYGEKDHNSRCPCMPFGNSLLYSLSLMVKSFGEDIRPSTNCVDTSRG